MFVCCNSRRSVCVYVCVCVRVCVCLCVLCVCEIKLEINKTHNIPLFFLFFSWGGAGGGVWALVVFRRQFTAGKIFEAQFL